MVEYSDSALSVRPFLSVTAGIIVLFVGKALNARYALLRDFHIPEPVSGGLLFAVAITLVYLVAGVQVNFELTARDILLVYFFTTIGINARLADLRAGGRPLTILLAVTVGMIVVQDAVGIGVATLLGAPPAVGLLGGSISLLGGHGTAIAWAPAFAERFGIANAPEIGVACATAGLVLASVLGGPVAKFLIKRNRLESTATGELEVGVGYDARSKPIEYFAFLHAILAVHVSAVFGFLLHALLEQAGIKLPLFVTCLFSGIVLSNTLPYLLPKAKWPMRTPAIALIADISLGVFLAMSLMSMQLWTLAGVAGPVLGMLVVQAAVVVLAALFVVFVLLGRNYDAGVISAGFIGFSLGATPTAIANMTAVTQRHGPSHIAFLVVPLVGAFFIDIANAAIIGVFLKWL